MILLRGFPQTYHTKRSETLNHPLPIQVPPAAFFGNHTEKQIYEEIFSHSKVRWIFESKATFYGNYSTKKSNFETSVIIRFSEFSDKTISFGNFPRYLIFVIFFQKSNFFGTFPTEGVCVELFIIK